MLNEFKKQFYKSEKNFTSKHLGFISTSEAADVGA